jgi:cell division protein FtsZ
VQGISDIITIAGQINVDFADVRAVMENAGPALMGIGYGVGEHRAVQAAQQATNSPLLERTIHGATGLLVNITSNADLTLAETNEAMTYIRNLCDEEDVNIYFGTVVDPTLENEIRISVLATGFVSAPSAQPVPVASAPRPVETPVQPVVPAPQPRTGASSADFIDQVRQTMTGGAPRNAPVEPEQVVDESDLDIPAFLREARRRNGQNQ